MQFKPLRVLKEYGGTRVTLGRDFVTGTYLIEKSVTTGDGFVIQLLQNEKQIYQNLRNQFILKYRGEGRTPLSFLTEYASFGNLIEYFSKRPSQEIICNFLSQILSGVSYLHDMGYVHNDLTASNILVCSSSRCKLSDFAMAGAIGSPAFPNRPDAFRMGTEGYRVREKISQHSIENDIFALGGLIYQMITGNSPQCRPVRSELKEPFATVVFRCFELGYSNALEILKDLGLKKSS
ncbi:MAG: protein kinase [Acidobacteria bacterium]|nr:protein kinase [Acidobacteriota bacterium]